MPRPERLKPRLQRHRAVPQPLEAPHVELRLPHRVLGPTTPRALGALGPRLVHREGVEVDAAPVAAAVQPQQQLQRRRLVHRGKGQAVLRAQPAVAVVPDSA